MTWKDVPSKDEVPGCHGRFNLRGNNDGYIGNVVKGSISHNDTRGCLSPAVDSSQPTYSQQIKRPSKNNSSSKIEVSIKILLL
jgi:hypothetical protein